MSVEVLLLWTSAALLAYTHLGYPLLIVGWAMLRPRPVARRAIEPSVSLVVVARDEAARIDARLDNALSLAYPQDRLEIVLASDGSTDATVDSARRYREAGVRVVAFDRPRGKPSVLNDVVPHCRGEIVVLADARQRFDAGALRALVACFADPRVGAVSGELILESDGGRPVAEGVGLYWRYEKAIRRAESRVWSTVGATGAIYAFRRALYEPLPPDTILDDVLVPVRIVRRGYRVVFEPEARAYDRAAASPGQELTRKVRTIAGNFQLLARERWLLDPLRSPVWLQALSHKALRLLTPLLLASALASNLLLLARPFYCWTLAGQVLFYGAAAAGHHARRGSRAGRLLGPPYVLCLLEWATVLAFGRFVGRRQAVTWAKASPRQAVR